MTAILLYDGLRLTRSPHDDGGVTTMALFTMIPSAITRAWDLLRAPDASLIAPLARLAERRMQRGGATSRANEH